MCKTWCPIILPLEYRNVIQVSVDSGCTRAKWKVFILACAVESVPSRDCLLRFLSRMLLQNICDPTTLFIFNLGATREGVVKATPRRLYPRWMTSVSIAEETGWTSGLLRAGMEKRKFLKTPDFLTSGVALFD